jgi:hypothetical protein
VLKGLFIREEDLLPLGERLAAYKPGWSAWLEEVFSEEYVGALQEALGVENPEELPSALEESAEWRAEDNALTEEEFLDREDLEPIRRIVGIIYLPKGYRVARIAPPLGQSWEDVLHSVKEGKPVFLRLWVEKFTTPPAPLRKRRYERVVSEIPIAFGLIRIDPKEQIAEYFPITRIGEVLGEGKEPGGRSLVVEYEFLHRPESKKPVTREELKEIVESIGGVVDESEIYNSLVELEERLEELKGKLSELESERQSLESQLESEKDKTKKAELRKRLKEVQREIKRLNAEIADVEVQKVSLEQKLEEIQRRRAERAEEEEEWASFAETMRERKEGEVSLRKESLRDVLLRKAAELVSSVVGWRGREFFPKGEGRR